MDKYILGIDTSGAESTVWLAKNENIRNLQQDLTAKNHANSLSQQINVALSEEGITIKDLTAVSVIGGPGSYTGLRVGLATAKGIAYGAEIGLLVHNRLDLMIVALQVKYASAFFWFGCLVHARQGECFYTIRSADNIVLMPPKHEDLAHVISILGRLDQPIILMSDIGEPDIAGMRHVTILPLSMEITHWIRSAFLAYQQNLFADIFTSEPFYLKEPFTRK